MLFFFVVRATSCSFSCLKALSLVLFRNNLLSVSGYRKLNETVWADTTVVWLSMYLSNHMPEGLSLEVLKRNTHDIDAVCNQLRSIKFFQKFL